MSKLELLGIVFAVFVIGCLILSVCILFLSIANNLYENALNYENLCKKIDTQALGNNDLDNFDLITIKKLLNDYRFMRLIE